MGLFFGVYHDVVLESRVLDGPEPDGVRRATLGDLTSLEPLLADGIDHAARIAAGDTCLIVEDEDKAVGVLWANITSHVDRYLGALSAPSRGTAYVNQVLISEQARGKGFGRRLLLGALAICGAMGISRVRLFVDNENRRMLGLCRSLGFEEVARQRGIRLGPATIRVNYRI